MNKNTLNQQVGFDMAKKHKKAIIIFVAIVIVAVFCVTSFFVARAKIYPTKYVEEIKTYSSQFNLPAPLVASVINTESSFNKNAQSNKGAIGLMQIKISTAQYMINYYNLNINLSQQNLFEVEQNLYFGCMYLNYLLNKFKDTNTALASYNAGETVVRSWLKNEQYSTDGKTLISIPYPETKNYVEKVNKNLKHYSKIF